VIYQELLELLGMPVLRAKWEAEGLCAELNQEGWVDACVTPDSDAFLHGAKCVIKVLQLDPKVSALTFDFAFLSFKTCFIRGNALLMKGTVHWCNGIVAELLNCSLLRVV
jgi:hypothetical protein